MANPRLEIEVVGDNSKLRKVLKDSETRTSAFAKKLEGVSAGQALGGRGGLAGGAALLRGGAIAIGAGIATQKVVELTQAASDLNEQQTKSQQVFGASAASVAKWSDTTASALGISKTAALEASGTFGNLFTTVGIQGQRAADLSTQLVGLASDLASFNNADPSDVLDALRSGLIGEAEPLRRFGVLLSETRVQQRAMADTGKDNAKELTNQEKALARVEIILHDTQKAQGDFQRTSGGLANQQRILKARLADTRAELGTHFLPVMVKLTEAANKFFDVLDGNQVTVDRFFSQDFRNKFADAFGIDALKAALDKAGPALNAALKDFAKTIQPIPLTLKPTVDTTNLPSFGQPGFKVGKAPRVPLGPSPELRNTIFDQDIQRRLTKVQDIGSLQGQIAELTKIEGLIEKRKAITKDITRQLNLQDQIDAIRREKKSLAAQIRQDAKDAKEAAKAAREEAEALAEQAKAARLARLTARQFRELGLAATGEPVVAGVGNLKKQIGQLKETIGGTKFDTPRLEQQLRRFQKVLSERLVPRDVRAKIQEMLDGILSDYKAFQDGLAKDGGPLTKTTQISADRILANLGLGRDAERVLRARLSHFNTAGVGLAGTGAGSNATTVVVDSPPIFIDGKLVSQNTSKHQRRRRNVNPSHRNGPNAGLIID